MRPAGRVLSLLSVAIVAAGCAVEQPSGPLASPLMDRSSAPGLQQGCSDKPGNHLARRPNAPLELLCAFGLPDVLPLVLVRTFCPVPVFVVRFTVVGLFPTAVLLNWVFSAGFLYPSVPP